MLCNIFYICFLMLYCANARGGGAVMTTCSSTITPTASSLRLLASGGPSAYHCPTLLLLQTNLALFSHVRAAAHLRVRVRVLCVRCVRVLCVRCSGTGGCRCWRAATRAGPLESRSRPNGASCPPRRRAGPPPTRPPTILYASHATHATHSHRTHSRTRACGFGAQDLVWGQEDVLQHIVNADKKEDADVGRRHILLDARPAERFLGQAGTTPPPQYEF